MRQDYPMKTLYAFLTLLSFNLAGQSLTIEQPIRFLALGDSYTIGESVSVNERWPVQLKDSLITKGINFDTLQIIATTGWRTDNLLTAITNKSLESKNFNLVSLLIGVNNQYQGRPISQYKIEFPKLLDSAIRYAGGDTSKVFVISIPDYAYTPFGQSTGNPSQISQEIDTYNFINKQITDSFGIKYFDITPMSRQGLMQPNLVASDGLHPSGVQYTDWVKLMLEHIDSVIAVSIKENYFEDSGIKVFPNPATHTIRIEYPSTEATTYEIMDNNGKTIKRGKFRQTEPIDIASVQAGNYILRLKNRKEEKKVRITISR